MYILIDDNIDGDDIQLSRRTMECSVGVSDIKREQNWVSFDGCIIRTDGFIFVNNSFIISKPNESYNGATIKFWDNKPNEAISSSIQFGLITNIGVCSFRFGCSDLNPVPKLYISLPTSE